MTQTLPTEPERTVRQRGRLQWLLLLSALAIPVLVTAAMVLHYEVNIPYLDDYRTVLDFGNRFLQADATGRLNLVFAMQHVEYKLVLMHLVIAVQVLLTRRVDFNTLNGIGNLFLLGIVWLQWKTYFRSTDRFKKLVLFAPIVLLVFNPNFAEAMDWVTASLMYQPLIFFVLASILLLTPPEDGPRDAVASFGLACGCAALACWSALNAVLLWPVGLFVLWRRRRLARAATWSAAFLIGLAPYLYRYHRLAYAEPNQWRILPAFFFNFLGGGAPMYRLALPVGIAIFGVFLLALQCGYLKVNETATVFGMWLVATAAMVAVGRNHSGIAFSHISRYKIFGDLLLVFCYGFAAESLQLRTAAYRHRTLLYGAALACSVALFLAGAWQGRSILRYQRALLEANAKYYWQNPVLHSPMHFDDADMERFWTERATEAHQELEQSMRLGLYLLPGKPADEQRAGPGRPADGHFVATDSERTVSR